MSDSPRSNRRQFLTARSLADETAHRAEQIVSALEAQLPRETGPRQPIPLAAPGAGDSAPDRRSYVLEVSRRAMACEFAVQLNAKASARETELAIDSLEMLEPLEQEMTVYRADSSVSVLNRLASTRSVPVSARLFRLLRLAQTLSRETDGAFDITSGPLIRAWGFHERKGRVPDELALQAATAVVGWRKVELHEQGQSVRFSVPGVEINLGGIGKGYAIDLCAQHLQEQGLGSFLMHGGQSSILARGHRQRGEDRNGWEVHLRHPLRPDRPIASIVLHDQAMSTSGCGTQHFYHQGQRFGHILDPRSGRPAERVLSATAVTPDAASADALSTAFYVLGEAGTEDYCREHPGVSALLMLPGAKSGELRLVSFGFRESGE